jgi:DNA polymerase III delta prime subunit
MLERQKVERANIEKQKKQRQNFFGHVPTSKKPKNHPVMAKKRRTTDDDDDDLWDDDECTNSNSAFDADLWSSLCVISGPVGCGKSNIVHRVAKELGCRKVVELHTGMKRNSATMKRIVEEATKSHSTFDMIQNQCKGATMDEESTLDDRGSAVTVILIDEVDNLDPDTDCGFWSALCDLYKESKCPIIVTCNSIPKELNATSFRWTHIPMYRPTPKQCAVQLRDILLQEGYTTRHAADVLVTIAQLGNCDVRRILQELQLFHVYTVSALSSTFCNDANDVGIVVQAGNVTRNTFPSNIFPIIESVHPNIIYFDRYTTITVKGTNFLSIIDLSEAKTMYHRCNVFIGSYCCPHAYVINDSTILAVVTPSVNMVSKYLPIYVSCTKRFGIISSTKNFITTIDLPDQSKMLATGQSYLVECRYGETADIDASDSEQEFDNDVRDEVACEKILECTSLSSSDPNKRRTSQTLNLDLTMQMLNESVHSFEARYGMPDEGHEANTTTFQKVTVDELAIIERVEALAGLASDASLFEDVGLNPVPFLSGSCRGFGFTYTEVFPKRTNECSKPYGPFFRFVIIPLAVLSKL